jgi:hypothetical protein
VNNMQTHITPQNRLASLGTVGLLLLAAVAGMVFLLPVSPAHAAASVSLSTISSGVETAATSGNVGSGLTITGNGFQSNKPIAITTTVGTTVVSWFTSASQNTCGGAFASSIGGIGSVNSLFTGASATACLTTTANGGFKVTVTTPALPGGSETIVVSDGTNTVSQAFTINAKVSFSVTGGSNFGFPEQGVASSITVTGFGALETVTEASTAFTTTGFSTTTNAFGSATLSSSTLTVADTTSGSKSITVTGGTSGLSNSATFTVNPWASFYDSSNGLTQFSFLGSAPTSLVIEAHGLPAGTIAANSVTIGGVAVSNAALTVPASGAVYNLVVAPTANVPFGQANVVLDGTTFSYSNGNIATSAGVTPGVTTATGSAAPWGGALISSIRGTAAVGTAVLTTDASNYKPGAATASKTSPKPQQNSIGFFGYGFVATTGATITTPAGSTLTGGLTPTSDANGAIFSVSALTNTPWSTLSNPTVAASYSPGITQLGGPANILGPSFGITAWISATAASSVDATTTGETFTVHGFGATDVITATVSGSSVGGTCTVASPADGCTTSGSAVPDLAGGSQTVTVTGGITGATTTTTLTYNPISNFYATTPSTTLSIVQGPSGSTTILRTSTGANIFGVHGLLANTAYTIVWNGMGSTQTLGTFTSTATGGIPVPGVQITLPADVAGIHVIDIATSASVGTSVLFANQDLGNLALSDSADTTGLGGTFTTDYGDQLFNLGTSLTATPTVANVGQAVSITGSGLSTSTAFDLGVSIGGIGTGSTPSTCALSGTGPASPPTVIVGTFTSTATGTVPSGTTLALTDMPTAPGLEQGTLYCAFSQTGSAFGTTTAVGTAQFLLAANANLNMTTAPIGHNVVISAHGLAANSGYNVLFAPYTNPGTSSITGTIVGAILSNANGAGSGTLTIPSNIQTATGSVPVSNGQGYTVELQHTGGSTSALATPPSLTVNSVSSSCNSTSCLAASGSPTQTQIGSNKAVQTVFTNNSNAPQTAIVFAVVHNALGQTVLYTTATLSLASGASGTAYDVLFGLAPGTYSVSIFASSTSGTAISATSTVSVTV